MRRSTPLEDLVAVHLQFGIATVKLLMRRSTPLEDLVAVTQSTPAVWHCNCEAFDTEGCELSAELRLLT